MQSYTVQFAVDAPPRRVWRVLHPPVPDDAPRPRILEYPTGSMEIMNEGDAAGEGLVRSCVFPVPRFLLSGGRARSWETVTEAEIDRLSRYISISKPLWSRAEGYHLLEEQPDGSTLLTFHESYQAHNPLMRLLFEKRVYRMITRDNLATYEYALGFAGTTRRV